MDDSFDRQQKGDSGTRFNRPKIPSKRKPAQNSSTKEEVKGKSARLIPEASEQQPSSCPYNLRSRSFAGSPATSRSRTTRCLLSRTLTRYSTQAPHSEVAKLQDKEAPPSQIPLPSSGPENKGNQDASDQPEPEGPRRSERIKKATGSCASNSRRGSQGRKPAWTRRSSANMSAEQSGRAEQGASSANTDSAENDDEPHGLFENTELKDGELSRLHTLLESRGIPPHLLGSLGPRMHQLLSRTLSSSSGGKVQQMLTGIQSSDEGVQLQAVIEMCQFLVMGNEESLAAFPVKEVVPALVNLLSMEHNFDMMNHACRSLTYLMEALPRSTAVVVDAVPVFIEKVQVIQCMDVAEQALAALEMLSKRHGKAILQAGGMSACLLYLDFFSITAQRSALAVAANCCQNVTDFQTVAEAIPVLSTRLQNQDKKSVDSCCLAFSRLVEVFHNNEKYLQEIASHGLLSNLQRLLIVTPPIISAGTFVMVLHLLAVVCANSPSLAATLLKQNISETLQYLLVGTTDVVDANMELLPRIPQEFFELTCIVSELLPSLPSHGIFAVDSLLNKNRQTAEQGLWQWRDDRGIWHTYSWIDSKIIETAYQRREDEVSFTVGGRPYNIDFNTMQQINEDTGTARPVQRSPGSTDSSDAPPKASATKTKAAGKEDERLKALLEDKEVAASHFSGIFAVLYSICDSTVGLAIKHKGMNAILRLLYYSPPELLDVIVKKHRVSSLIGGMLKSQDLQTLVNALQMAELLMQKLPDAFHVSFRREGVMHKIHDMAYVWSKEHVPGDAGAAALKNSPAAADVKTQNPDNSSMQPRRLGDILRRKRRSKRAVMKGKMQDANSNPRRTMEDDFHVIEPRDGAFIMNHERMMSELAAGAWGQRSLAGTLAGTGSQRSKFDLGACAASPSSKSKVRLWIKEQAEKFCTTYFDKDQRESHPALDIVHRLRTAAEGLSLANEDSLPALKEICKCVSESSDSACTFEILHSGLVPRLLSYLSSTSPECALPQEQRLKLFICAFMNVSLQDADKAPPTIGENDVKPALIPLLQKLHACTNQLEQFPVNLNDTLMGLAGAGGSRGSQALRFFSTHQIKCQLQRHPSCVNVKQWKRGPVKIDPLALVQAIERYLVVRGFGKPRESTDDEGSDDDGSDEDIDEAMMKELQSDSSTRHHVEILIGDHVLPYNMTVYQCIKQYGQFDEERDVNHDHGILGRPSIWIGTHTIMYRLVNSKDSSPGSKRKASGQPKAAPKPSTRRSSKEVSSDKCSLVHLLSTCTPSIFSISDPCLEAVCLMKALHALNAGWPELYRSTSVQKPETFVSSTEFINHKLTAKVTRQLQDPITVITGNFPSWLSELPRKCPFLFPFECRQQLFFCTAFDRERAMIKLGETVPDLISTEVSERVAPRIDRKKLKVSREGLFENAEKLVENLGSSTSILEVHYEGEVGTGLGPTLEFYALVSKEFQSSDLEMWRGETVPAPDGESGTSYKFSPSGLFPAPLGRSVKAPKVCAKFNFLGKFLARALMDFRMVDIPLNQTFYKWMLGQEDTLGMKDFEQVDAGFAQTMRQFYGVVLQKKRLEEDSEHTPQSLKLAIDNLTMDGESIEDFGFAFTLPGHDEIELKKQGKDTPVTVHNLDEFLKLTIQCSLVEGVRRQFQAFREGFESVFPLSRLSIFTPSELQLLLCGSAKESWDFNGLVKSCRPDHGYTQDSPTIKFLYEILSSYSSEEQRLFLQFVTGSPRLPVGGLRSLNPPLTIVRKALDPPLCADNYLPSVMTCVNYLKLPDYSTKEIMADKLRLAALEGQRSFHLS